MRALDRIVAPLTFAQANTGVLPAPNESLTWQTWLVWLSLVALPPAAAYLLRALYRRSLAHALVAADTSASVASYARGADSPPSPPPGHLQFVETEADSPWVRAIDGRRSALLWAYLAASAAALATLGAVLAFHRTAAFGITAGVWAFLAAVPLLRMLRLVRASKLRPASSAVTFAGNALGFVVAQFVILAARTEKASPSAVTLSVAVVVVSLAAWLLLRLYLRVSAWRVRRGRMSTETSAILLSWGLWAAIPALLLGPIVSEVNLSDLGEAQRIGLIHWTVLAACLAFATFVAALTLGHRMVRKRVIRGARFQLLVFRAFGHDRLRRRLLERVIDQWRHLGEVFLLSGTDLGAETMDPDAFRAFLSRKLGRWFISSEGQLEERLARIGRPPASDGRYAVHEFPCFANTWRDVARRLIGRADAILFDLRGLDASHAGVVAEVAEIVDTAPVAKVVLITDVTTDGARLQEVLGTAWRRMALASPNRTEGVGPLRALRVRRSGRRTADLLLHMICEGAASAGKGTSECDPATPEASAGAAPVAALS